ncbi:PD-(D/E)XK nuclease family protein [Halopenitus sp. POP-27]|uniref:PD-(D/E)XK nuclease family protein n=1 Tax=Halopenitus sp. POP-27 TaxID=2994425 RepID=UPI00246954D5|nr:PD-(D/E)XK nuclease family protein [Halopenitus sp. POP-27]
MSITDDRAITHVLERDVDLFVIQLLQTSPGFRNWFFEHLEPEDKPDQFLGIEHSVTDTKGESDIVFGVETQDGQRYLLLIENKIDAAKQERQAERYYERGQSYVANRSWDEFRVGLIAPARYIGRAERKEFQTVIQYEEILDRLEELNHDGIPFIRDVFESAIERRPGTDHSGLTAEISDRLTVSDRLPPLEPPTVNPTHVELHSRHPDHPQNVFYRVYFPGSKDGNKAIVRLQISSDATEAEEERIRSVLSSSIDELDGFEYEPGRIMDAVWTEIWREEESSEGRKAYIDQVAEAVHELLNFYHPRLVTAEHKTE